MEASAVLRRDTRAERDIPDAAREAERDVTATRTVVVEMLPPDVAKVAPTEAMEVRRVVNPLLDHVALQDGRHEQGGGRQGRQVAKQRERHRERDRIEPAVDVPAVPRAQVVVAVRAVENAVQPTLEPARTVGESPVQGMTVHEVLDEGPGDHTGRDGQSGRPAILTESDDRNGQRI